MSLKSTEFTVSTESTATNNHWYTVENVMDMLGIGRKAVYSLIRKNKFRIIKITGLGYHIPEESSENWLRKKQ